MYLEKNGERIIEDLEYAGRFLKKIKGLMFREIEENEGILMEFSEEGKWSIWMFFVPQDLSVFFLDSKGVVVDRVKAKKVTLDPRTWKIYKPKRKCKYILECSPSCFDDIGIGERLEWNHG